MPRALPRIDWAAIELLYLNSPEDISVRDLARRLALSENTVLSRAKRGKWAEKRAAAKASIESPASPASECVNTSADGDSLATPSLGGSEGAGESGEGSQLQLKVKGPKQSGKADAWKLLPEELKQRAATVKANRAETYEREMAALATRVPGLLAELSDRELLTRSGDVVKLDQMARKALGIEGAETQRAPLVQIALLSNADAQAVKVCGKTV